MTDKFIEDFLELAERFVSNEELKTKLLERNVLALEANTDAMKTLAKVAFDANQNFVHFIEKRFYSVGGGG